MALYPLESHYIFQQILYMRLAVSKKEKKKKKNTFNKGETLQPT